MLTVTQITEIENIVDRAGIFYSHLRDDLIDHICCDIEEGVSSGLSFFEALERVRQKFGIQTLKNIQQDTLYLTDLKYRKMKNTSKITGNIALAQIAIGALFKIMHWPGAGALLTLGFFALIAIFYPTAIFIHYKETKASKGKKFLHISALIGGIAFMAGVLFKIMHWPGAAPLLEAGWLIISLIFLPVLLIIKRQQSNSSREKTLFTFGVIAIVVYNLANLFKIMHYPGAGALFIFGSVLLVVFFIFIAVNKKFGEENYVTGKFIFLITTALYFILFSTLLALNVSKNVLDNFNRTAEQTTKANEYLNTKSEQYFTKISNTSMGSSAIQLKSAGDTVLETLEEMKIQMVMLSHNCSAKEAKNKIDTLSQIFARDNWQVVEEVALVNRNAAKLRTQINTFSQCVTELNPNDITSDLLKMPDPHAEIHYTTSWDTLYFYRTTLIGALSTLSQLEKDVRQVQLDTYREIYVRQFIAEKESTGQDSITKIN